MRTLVLVLTALFAQYAMSSAALASHVQLIGKQSAKAFCADHGGGTSCSFCHRDHCHAIGCNSKNSNECYNEVYRKGARHSVRGAFHPPRGKFAPPGYHRHRVNIGGLRAPSAGLKQPGDGHSSGVIMRTSNHFSSHHR